MKTYRVSYDIKGVRVVDVTIKEQDIPENWDTLTEQEQDELLYERQQYSVLHLEDVDYGKAQSILELRSDFKVVS
jgi:hypothetical protein